VWPTVHPRQLVLPVPLPPVKDVVGAVLPVRVWTVPLQVPTHLSIAPTTRGSSTTHNCALMLLVAHTNTAIRVPSTLCARGVWAPGPVWPLISLLVVLPAALGSTRVHADVDITIIVSIVKVYLDSGACVDVLCGFVCSGVYFYFS
jgi:hypothetical protein